ncbi:MAG: histidine kinase [Chitinophagales bacterium]
MPNYKKSGFLLSLVLVLTGVRAQTSRLDSLKKVLPNTQRTAYADCLNQISQEYYAINTDSAFWYASEAFRKSEEDGYRKGMSDGLNNLGAIMRERGDNISSEKYFRQALAISEKEIPSDEWARDVQALGNNLFLQGQFPEATKLVEKSLNYYLQTGNEKMQDYTYRMMGTIYTAQGYYEKGFSYLQKGFAIGSKVKDPVGSHSSTYMWNTYLLGELYKDAGDYPTALQYYNLSLMRAKENISLVDYYHILGAMAMLRNQYDSAAFFYNREIYFVKERIPDPTIAGFFLFEPYIELGELCLVTKNYPAALQYLEKPLPILLKGNNNTPALTSLRAIAKVYLAQRNWKLSFQYAQQLLTRARATGSRTFIRDGYDLYWKIYDGMGNMENAYKYHLRYTDIHDSIAKDVQLRNIAVGLMKTWQVQQESKIELLKKEKKIQAQEAQLILYSLIAIVCIALIIFWIIILKRKSAVIRSKHLEDIVKLQTLESEKIITAFEHKAAELEMQALRAQMNPHFIFNSLNAINRFILQNNREQASAYLTKFSRLVRMILNHSRENLISLENELESLQLYLELETLRFDNHFSFEIKVGENLDLASLQIPPLIIQPFAENAIWHGLMHKKGKGLLHIELLTSGDVLHCRIIDDGVGRKKATILKNNSAVTYKSMGMRITADRISRIQHNQDADDFIQINDLVLPDGSPGGTEVILKIPLIYV